jgi:ferric-dicitrate binding protein FerR (iron transport regulator)
MSPANEQNLDRAHALMMAALDNECTEEERRELEEHIARRPELEAEWTRLKRVKEVTMSMEAARPPEELWDRYRRSVVHRGERGVAWTLIAAGVATLGAWALWHWLEAWLARDLPIVVKVASAALMVGAALLLLSIVRERWHLRHRDPYSKEILR